MITPMRALALLSGLVLSGLVLSPTAKAADMEAIPEETSAFGWYFSLFGGYKWGDGEVDLTSVRQSDSPLCLVLFCPTYTEELHGEVDNGWIFGGALGAQLTDNIRTEIEISHARLDTETIATQNETVPLCCSPLFTTSDEDQLHETFILANLWLGLPISSMFSPYVGGGLGVAHVNGEFSVDPFGAAPPNSFSASIEADDWTFAYQLGAGLLIGFSEDIAIDIGYRFKAIPNVDLDDPELCSGGCVPPAEDFTADDELDLHEHVAQIGITIGF